MAINFGRALLAAGTLGGSEALNAVGVDMSGLPVVGGFFESPEQKQLQEQYKALQEAYQAYRPVAQQARMNALRNALSPGMLNPLQSQLSHMYGPGAQFDVSALLQDPLGMANETIGAQAQSEADAAAAAERGAGPPGTRHPDDLSNVYSQGAATVTGQLPGFSFLGAEPQKEHPGGPGRTTASPSGSPSPYQGYGSSYQGKPKKTTKAKKL